MSVSVARFTIARPFETTALARPTVSRRAPRRVSISAPFGIAPARRSRVKRRLPGARTRTVPRTGEATGSRRGAPTGSLVGGWEPIGSAGPVLGPPPPRSGAAAAEVDDVDVGLAVGVVRDERATAVELEGDEASVAGDRGRECVVAGAEPGAWALADAPRGVVLAVVDEDVDDVVGVAGDQGRVERREGDEAAVGRDRRLDRVVGALGPVARDADALGHVAVAVVNEDVAAVVAVAGDEVGRVRLEGHDRAVAGDRRILGVAVGCAPPSPRLTRSVPPRGR